MMDFLSAKGRLLVLRIIRFVALLSIFYNVVTLKEELPVVLLLSALLIIVVANDIIREKILKDHKTIWYSFSYILSNIIAAYFSYKIKGDGTFMYNIVLQIDVLIFNQKIPVVLLIINFIAFCIPYKINAIPSNISSIKDIFIYYLNSFVVVFVVRSMFMEKLKTDKLNKDLISANQKLKEYSTKIEELTSAKERTRIAQELHDSIGHSLIALSMNLDYAENVVDLKPEKAKEVINKAHIISKDCIVKLREVVSVLKEDTSIISLKEAVNRLFENFHHNERYEFYFEMDDAIETELPEIKSCLYKIIMEGITNGIKHGNADVFNIKLIKAFDNIIFEINNNGVGCGNIKKSNGIDGIEKRITNLGGIVEFYSEKINGFAIHGKIPVGRRNL
jgi:signal transduction histidine kinase